MKSCNRSTSVDSPSIDKPKFKESDISGLKYFDKLAPLLERLHDDACERDKAGNRELHFDQYCLLILLYLFNPIVTSLRGIQQASELDKVQKKLESDRLYVMDRGYAKFALFNKIVKANSSYVCRLRDNRVYEVVEERELTDADRAAGILGDQIILIGHRGKSHARPDHKIRLVCVKCSPHTSRGKYKGSSTGPDRDGVLRIATNLLDPPAEIIGLIYSER
jgi:hypothetical protein